MTTAQSDLGCNLLGLTPAAEEVRPTTCNVYPILSSKKEMSQTNIRKHTICFQTKHFYVV